MDLADAVPKLTENHLGTLATLKRDGRPQLSDVVFAYSDGTVRISTTDNRAKTANIRRDPRVSLHVHSGKWGYVVAEGNATLSGVTTEPGDPIGKELLEIHDLIQGRPHPDPEEFFEVMVTDKRLVLSLPVERVYGFSTASGRSISMPWGEQRLLGRP